VSYAHPLKIKSCVTSLDAFSQKGRGFTAIAVLIATESIDWKMNLSSKLRWCEARVQTGWLRDALFVPKVSEQGVAGGARYLETMMNLVRR